MIIRVNYNIHNCHPTLETCSMD